MRNKKTYYYTCPRCGEILDPGERCECLVKARNREAKRISTNLQINKMCESKAQQLTLRCCS